MAVEATFGDVSRTEAPGGGALGPTPGLTGRPQTRASSAGVRPDPPGHEGTIRIWRGPGVRTLEDPII